MEPVQQQSYLGWMFQSLGPVYGLALPLAGFAVFVGGCLVVLLSKRNSVVAAYLAVLPFPLMIGLLGTIHGMMSSFQVMGISSVAPRPADLAMGFSMALFSSLIGLLVTFPSYFVVVGGLLVRTMMAPRDGK